MYKLGATLEGHHQDVKAVTVLSNDYVFTAGRDSTVRSWKRLTTNSFTQESVYNGHDHYVNALTVLPPSAHHPNGLIVSAGSDKVINISDAYAPHETVATLVGHTENICTLAVTPSGDIVSGSWDKKVIVWKDFQPLYTLEGHTAAVWAVVAVDDRIILSGSADKTIRLWKDGKQIRVIQAHNDVVRGLALIPGTGFVSCSNDATLKVWSFDGELLQELCGHTSFVYSVGLLSTGEIVSSGEDGTVRVWKDGKCFQSIQLPCLTAWAVSTLPNGDIIVGSSDAATRIFTRAEERMADAETQKQYAELLASHSIPSNQLGDVKKDSLPGIEALMAPGRSEGQVIMINNNNLVEAYQWSTQEQTWQKIGEVIGGVSSGRKTLFEGKEYDYVFDIDIGGGPAAMLKLPYNVRDNPYEAAQKFIWKHDLPQHFLDQIADFITKNAEGVELGQSSAQYQDPYTGGNRYTPGQSFGSASGPSQFSDPFTGAASYSGPHQNSIANPPSPPAAASTIPLSQYLSLKQANLDAIEAKLKLTNKELGELALNEREIEQLSSAVQYLKKPQLLSAEDSCLSVITKICQTWPFAKRFPGLDLLRLFAIYAPDAIARVTPDHDPVGFILSSGGITGNTEIDAPEKIIETNAMLAYRGLANMFNQQPGRDIAWSSRANIGFALQTDRIMPLKGKAVRLAITTLAVNFAILLTANNDADEDAQINMTGALLELIVDEKDEENLYRALAALGTLMSRSESCREAADIMGVRSKLQSLVAAKTTQGRVLRLTKEILAIPKATVQ